MFLTARYADGGGVLSVPIFCVKKPHHGCWSSPDFPSPIMRRCTILPEESAVEGRRPPKRAALNGVPVAGSVSLLLTNGL